MRLGHAIFVATTAALLAAAVPGLARNAETPKTRAITVETQTSIRLKPCCVRFLCVMSMARGVTT